jgi:hypothetical protein
MHMGNDERREDDSFMVTMMISVVNSLLSLVCGGFTGSFLFWGVVMMISDVRRDF